MLFMAISCRLQLLSDNHLTTSEEVPTLFDELILGCDRFETGVYSSLKHIS